MFETNLVIAFIFMALLFLRQVYILKQPNKINYAPLMLGIGAVSSVVHFIIHPDTTNVIYLLRESFFPLLVSILLYIIMNILHQTQVSENAKTQEEFTRVMVSEVSQLKKFILELEERMNSSQLLERESQEEIRSKFKEDINALESIQQNQIKFLDMFKDLGYRNQEVSNGLKNFTEVQLPALDDVVHKHIDILRVAEQDHYNKLTTFLEKAVASRGNMSEDIDELKKSIDSVKHISSSVSESIVKHTTGNLLGVTKSLESQVLSLKSQAEGMSTSLTEGEGTLSSIKEQSEMIMKQMILSSSKMNEIEKQNSGLHNIYASLESLMEDIENIKSDYVKSQAQLSSISKELAISKDEDVEIMRNRINKLSDELTQKIEESLAKLHEHYHIAGEDITQSVQLLAKKVQQKKGYGDLDS